MTSLIPYELLKELIIHGVRFSYESYDHKKALAELKQIRDSGVNPYSSMTTLVNDLLNTPEFNWFIPDEVKKNNLVWRAGRIWEVHFNKERQMYLFKVGNRYPKNFYLSDFGVRVKPMLFKSEDKHDLIGQGLAIEERF